MENTADNPGDTLLFAVENTHPLTIPFPWDSTSQIAFALDCHYGCYKKSGTFLLLLVKDLLFLPKLSLQSDFVNLLLLSILICSAV